MLLTTDQDFLTAMHTLAAMKTLTREYEALVKGAAEDYLANNGPVETQTERYYLGQSKTTKVKDKAAALEALLSAVGGDLERLAACLTAQPIKHGTARNFLGGEWAEHFDVIVADRVELKKTDPARLGERNQEWD